jgi:hypothetical protein
MITGVYLLEKHVYPQVDDPLWPIWRKVNARLACSGKPGIE